MWIKYMVEGITFIFSVASTRTLSLCISKFWIWRGWVQFLSHLLLKFMPSHLWSILFVLHVVRLVFECIWLFVFCHYRFASWPRYTILTLIRQGSSSSPSLFPTYFKSEIYEVLEHKIDFFMQLGRICLDILKDKWSPALQIRTVLLRWHICAPI